MDPTAVEGEGLSAATEVENPPKQHPPGIAPPPQLGDEIAAQGSEGRGGSSGGTQMRSGSVPGDTIDASPSILRGWTPEAEHATLCYGDIITLVPSNCNGCVAYAGGLDGRAWVEELGSYASTPPNMEDCKFRVIPRRQYAEARQVSKLVVKGAWDDGKRLPLPDVRGAASLDDIEGEFAREHGLRVGCRAHLREMLEALREREEEREENDADYRRQAGHEVLYGSMVQLMHVSTCAMLTVSKLQATERTDKRVELLREGTEASVLVVRPAFKTHGQGEPVSSGDLVTFSTKRKIHGNTLYLHVSSFSAPSGGSCDAACKAGAQGGAPSRAGSGQGGGLQPRTPSGAGGGELRLDEVVTSLKTDSLAIEGARALNATAERPTFWRPLLFSSHKDTECDEQLLKGSDFVCFYDRDVEAYLSYTAEYGPHFRVSKRVSSKARKKSHWMWKIESTTLVGAGAKVRCCEGAKYHIKHVVTGQYLQRIGSSLTMTREYWRDSCLFSFKRFSRSSTDDSTSRQSLVFLHSPGATPVWVAADSLPLVRGNRSEAPETDRERAGLGSEVDRVLGVLLSQQEHVSEDIALSIMPLTHDDIATVHKFRAANTVLSNYCHRLDACSGLPCSGPEDPPEQLPVAVEEVLSVVSSLHDTVMDTLKELILALSEEDEETDPWVRDGVPNTVSQKLMLV